MTGGKKAQKVKVLDRVFYLCYLVQFQKDKNKDFLTLFGSKSEVNAITLAYAVQLGLKMQKTNVNAQKIDRFSLKTYGMVIATFYVLDKLGCFQFF